MSGVLAWNRQAMQALNNNNITQASQLLKQAQKKLISDTPGQDHSFLWAITFNNQGCLYKRLSKPVVALHYFHRALQIHSQSPSNSSNIAGTFLNVCTIQSQLNRHQKALQSAQKAIQILKKSPKQSKTYQNTLIIAYLKSGVEFTHVNQIGEAAKMFHTGWILARQNFGHSNKLTQILEHNYQQAIQNRSSVKKNPSNDLNKKPLRSPRSRNFSTKNRPSSKRLYKSMPYEIPTVKSRKFRIYDLGSSRPSSRASSVCSNRSSVGIQVSIPEKFQTFKEKAVRSIQKVWRGYSQRKKEQEEKLSRQIREAEMKAQQAITDLQMLRQKKQSRHTYRHTVRTLPVPQKTRVPSVNLRYNFRHN